MGNSIRAKDIDKVALSSWTYADNDKLLFNAVEGFLLGTYVFRTHKKKNKNVVDFSKLDVVLSKSKQDKSDKEKLKCVLAVVEGCFLTRDLVNEPANIMNPTGMEKVAKSIAKGSSWKIKVLNLSLIHI